MGRSNTMVQAGFRRRNGATLSSAVATLLALSPHSTTAQSEECTSLEGSELCPAFESASISTNANLTGAYSFLQFVSDTKSFDNQLASYVKTTYIRDKYQSVFGCGDIDLTDSDDWYARFTTSVICNAIVQMSIEPCGLSEEESVPLCADSCAEYAQSASYLTSNDQTCSNPNENLNDLIEADFVNCYLPSRGLHTCMDATENESENCGFGNSTLAFCWYCSEGGMNSTDTCCYNADAEERCEDVDLPSLAVTLTLEPTATSTSEPDGADDEEDDNDDNGGLSGGAIAGIVIGVIAGVALIAAALFFCIRKMRNRQGSQQGSIFNQPSPSRKGPSSMTQVQQEAPQGYEVLPGGRIARMSALEGHSGDSSSQHGKSAAAAGAAGAAGAGAGYAAGRRKDSNTQSSSDEFGSPESEPRAGVLRPPPSAMRRNGSLSSNSVFGTSVPQSPTSAEGGFSSPQGVGSQQSEQLPFFKDYYSQDDIHPGDRVAVLWAYQPRATDEFALERGDMIKVVGIWDDGWATGIMLDDRADDWESRRQAQRDSGVSNASGRRDSSPAAAGEIKAFPLVCVCLPDHWRKTIEGDGSTEAGSIGHIGLGSQT